MTKQEKITKLKEVLKEVSDLTTELNLEGIDLVLEASCAQKTVGFYLTAKSAKKAPFQLVIKSAEIAQSLEV